MLQKYIRFQLTSKEAEQLRERYPQLDINKENNMEALLVRIESNPNMLLLYSEGITFALSEVIVAPITVKAVPRLKFIPRLSGGRKYMTRPIELSERTPTQKDLRDAERAQSFERASDVQSADAILRMEIANHRQQNRNRRELVFWNIVNAVLKRASGNGTDKSRLDQWRLKKAQRFLRILRSDNDCTHWFRGI